MVFSKPKGKDVVSLIEGKHRIESREVADGLLDHGRLGIHEGPVNERGVLPEFLGAFCREEKRYGVLALSLFSQLLDD